jgi:hypothetical protein
MTDDEFFAAALLALGRPSLTVGCADQFVKLLEAKLGYDPPTTERMNWFFRFRKWAERQQ